jgi:GH15 family glucan-1,4-alpha-glucosidase
MINRADDKSILDTTLDMSSLYGIYKFGVLPLDDERVKHTVALVEEKLRAQTHVDGYCRYQGDQYFYSGEGAPGNPWFITTLWLSQYYIATATSAQDLQKPLGWLQWVNNHALGSGVLSEQLNPFTGAKVSATPLTWSHAEFVVTVLELVAKQKELGICPTPIGQEA